jgi:ubiquinone/menaquinone biosynthesis C-methylase UbiE
MSIAPSETVAGDSSAAGRAFALRMFQTMVATQEMLTIYLGVKLGAYESLAVDGPATPRQLAERCGLDLRYAREWLEQQTVAEILTVDDPGLPEEERTFALGTGHGEVLRQSDSLVAMASLFTVIGGVARALPDLVQAFRTGAGVPDDSYGEDWRAGHPNANLGPFTHYLANWVRTWLPSAHARLHSGGSAVDVACGAGLASIVLARAYPQASFHGIDLDAQSIEDARANADAAGVADRVTFTHADAAEYALTRQFDLVLLIDALHEMAKPVEVLSACRALRAPGGDMMLMDARVLPEFQVPANEVERFQYNTSVLHCLPVSRVDPDSYATGTAMRASHVREFARAAGFDAVRVLGLEDSFHLLYHLIG